MKHFGESILRTLVSGILLIIPIYVAILLLLKAMKSLGGVVRPLARLLPESFPAEPVFSLLAVLMLCLLVGIVLRTQVGQTARIKIEESILQKIPGYEVFRNMTEQLVGRGQESAWQPALAEIEEALVPAFIVEELDERRFTVFVPSAPTLMTGSIYILTHDRVHPLDIPFTHAVKVVTRWGSGSRELTAAMERTRSPSQCFAVSRVPR